MTVSIARPEATRLLAEYAARLAYEQLPSTVIEAAKTALIDWIAVAAVGSRTRQGIAAAAVARAERANPESTLFNDGTATSATWAAFANGTASHTIELDDIHLPSIVHGGVAMIGAAVAVAQKLNADGKQLIGALVVGFDVQYRIGEAIAASHYGKFHSTGTVGTFGAAAACAKLMNLDVLQTQWALGNAGSQAAGLWQYLKIGDDTKVLHPGKSCMNGVIAANLAAQGFTGSVDIIEGERGFIATMSDQVDWDRITDRLGSYFKVVENGYKIHACCRHGHVTIDQTLRIVEAGDLTAKDIERVTVKLPTNSSITIDDPNPPSAYKAKFSVQFMVANAIIYRRVGLEAFTAKRLSDRSVRELMSRVEVVEEPAFNEGFPDKWTAEVTIETADGRCLVGSSDMPLGEWVNPVPASRVEEKARDLLSLVMDESSIDTLVARLADLQTVDNVSAMLPEIGGSAPKLRAVV
ncbi:MmgE/PrpD family protein [Aurantimonas sp. C2-6-R+9]|uniref:MmgE/PrpD family protein n=1 Tax=unclassified Aurantimonas TaxID=2638230 RepID=UPI002E19D5AE|nr:MULTISPECIES: MmgE/PrpD family protein [unclassified Aurantimonas]MEC5293419.1 MmgE/PrpD family protein [Aurantimonas sp. C2-3-R2]MEC5383580.1 MmgE/PrpD family protein [Aurantimonas sp. C2-6-R+9]MEC5414500.1 MmgE/PrpD family protein [Aurantimonas sp. C2-4-R8]